MEHIHDIETFEDTLLKKGQLYALPHPTRYEFVVVECMAMIPDLTDVIEMEAVVTFYPIGGLTNELLYKFRQCLSNTWSSEYIMMQFKGEDMKFSMKNCEAIEISSDMIGVRATLIPSY